MAERHIYLDNAASTPMDPDVFDVMRPYLCDFMGNPSSTHAHGRKLKTAIEQARRTISQLLHASPSEIIFTGGGTEADNIALIGAANLYDIKHIISTEIEHHAVSHTLAYLRAKHNTELHWLSVDAQGNINLDELKTLLSKFPGSLVSLMHGNNEIGTLYDLPSIASICKEYEAILHSDTVQTVGHISYDLSSLPLDFMAASAHKFYGPKGTGFMFVKKDHKLSSIIHGGGQERGLRPGTENVAGIVGMAKALEKCYQHLEAKNQHLLSLKNYMMEQLNLHIPGVSYNGVTDKLHSLPTVLNVAFPGCDSSMLTFQLDIQGISASGGSACSSGASTGSHVLRGLRHSEERIASSIRFSFGMENTKEEIDFTVQKLKEIVPIPA